MEVNYISAEIEVLKSLDVEHVVFLYTDSRRVIHFDHKHFKWVMDYLEVQGFTINSIVKTKSQYSISF